MKHNELVENIIMLEWVMFQNTQNKGGRADCQNDMQTFHGMRFGQFDAWSDEVLADYLEDLTGSIQEGRNLIAEKYLRMMEYTFPEEYEQQKDRIPPLDEAAKTLADDITKEMVRQTASLFRKYPHVAGAGRPLYSSGDGGGQTSVETYQRGELYTYSLKTLAALHKHLFALQQSGESLAEQILENSVRSYGFKSLEEAEELAARRERK